MQNLSIAVTCHNKKNLQAAQEIALHLHIPFDQDITPYQWILTMTDQGLELARQGDSQIKGAIRVDFTAGRINYRRKQSKKELLVQAIGCKAGQPWKVIDGTGGMGQDSFILAAAGCEVTVYERHPVIAALFADGLYRSNFNPDTTVISRRIHLISADIIDQFQNRDDWTTVDAVYLDPMFPPRQKSAKVKKELQILQMLEDTGSNPRELFSVALTAAKHRIVVKRPRKAPTLTEITPTYTLSGKTVRFDVYLKKNLPGKI